MTITFHFRFSGIGQHQLLCTRAMWRAFFHMVAPRCLNPARFEPDASPMRARCELDASLSGGCLSGLTAAAANEAEQATEHNGSDAASHGLSHDERSVGAWPGDRFVAQRNVYIGESEHGNQADANEELHEDLARDRRAARLVWVQVHAEEKSSELSELAYPQAQARNGPAVRVGPPVRKVVAVLLDHGV